MPIQMEYSVPDWRSVPTTAGNRIRRARFYFDQYPSEGLIRRLAAALEADEDELLILTRKIPRAIRERVFERREAFTSWLDDDAMLDQVMVSTNNSALLRDTRIAVSSDDIRTALWTIQEAVLFDTGR